MGFMKNQLVSNPCANDVARVLAHHKTILLPSTFFNGENFISSTKAHRYAYPHVRRPPNPGQ